MAEIPRSGDIVTDTENVLRTVFGYTNENILKTCLQLSKTFFHSNKKLFATFGHFSPAATHSVKVRSHDSSELGVVEGRF